MNDHDIVTIDQKQKLINKTEKYKNTRKENFFCCLTRKTLRHEKISKFNYTSARRSCSDTVKRALWITVCWCLQEKIFSQVVNNFSLTEVWKPNTVNVGDKQIQ